MSKNLEGILNVELNKPMLLSVKHSKAPQGMKITLRMREGRKELIEQEQWKGKSVLGVIEEMKKKKARVGSDIKSLNETGNELCVKAEATGK